MNLLKKSQNKIIFAWLKNQVEKNSIMFNWEMNVCDMSAQHVSLLAMNKKSEIFRLSEMLHLNSAELWLITFNRQLTIVELKLETIF